jgi:hypothetical protein
MSLYQQLDLHLVLSLALPPIGVDEVDLGVKVEGRSVELFLLAPGIRLTATLP